MFTFDGTQLDIVQAYRYLGVILDEHLSFLANAEALSAASGRALGLIRYKLKFLKECRSITFARLFTLYVCPIPDYGAGVWGTKSFGVFEQMRRAIRYFWGLHRFAPVDMLQGDMGWISCYTRHKLCVLRLWNRLVMLEANRLTCKIFLWDQAFAGLAMCLLS